MEKQIEEKFKEIYIETVNRINELFKEYEKEMN